MQQHWVQDALGAGHVLRGSGLWLLLFVLLLLFLLLTLPCTAISPQVPNTVYLWPTVAFVTASVLNLLSLAFERRSSKMQVHRALPLLALAPAVACSGEWRGRAGAEPGPERQELGCPSPRGDHVRRRVDCCSR